MNTLSKTSSSTTPDICVTHEGKIIVQQSTQQKDLQEAKDAIKNVFNKILESRQESKDKTMLAKTRIWVYPTEIRVMRENLIPLYAYFDTIKSQGARQEFIDELKRQGYFEMITNRINFIFSAQDCYLHENRKYPSLTKAIMKERKQVEKFESFLIKLLE